MSNCVEIAPRRKDQDEVPPRRVEAKISTRKCGFVLGGVPKAVQNLFCVFTLAAVMLGGSGRSAASESECAVFDDLATLVHLSELLLDNVEVGANPKAAGQLGKFLGRTSVVDLRLELEENGFGTISAPTAKFIALQKALLKIRSIGGQFKASEAARKMQLRRKLNQYRQQLVALPCYTGQRDGAKRAGTAADSLISSKTASIGAIFLLIVGVIAFLVFDRINKINSRKKKRYICNADCLVHNSQQNELIEAQIVDVSQIGAKVKSEATCPVGAEVEVNVPEKKLVFSEHTITYASWSIPARVLWRNGNYFGLEFKGLMGVDHLDQLVATS